MPRRCRRARPINTRSSARQASCCRSRPIRSAFRASCDPPPPHSPRASIALSGTIRLIWRAVPRATPAGGRWRSTRCISAPGSAAKATASSPMTNWPTASSLCPMDGLHPSGAAADHRASARYVLGLPADRDVRADEALRRSLGLRPLRRPRPSRRFEASCSIGCRRIFRSTCTGSPASMGTYLYEHEDPRKGFHPDWNTAIYNFSRREVSATLVSNAMYWFDVFHIDGLRVDAVASMLYLDYSRKDGEWIPNEDGSNDNREAVAFLRPRQRAVLCDPSGHDDDRRGIHRLGGCLGADLCGRPGLRLQVEHGLDARHPGLHGPGSGAPAVAPRTA